MDTSDERGEDRHGASDQQGTLSRREVMRRGAVIGGAAAWAVPTVQTIGLRAAGATTTGTPQPACCHAHAFGLYVNALGIVDDTFGVDGCVFNISTGTHDIVNEPDVRVSVRLVCGEWDEPEGGSCRGEASIARLEVEVGGSLLGLLGQSLLVEADTLTSWAEAPCDPDCNTRGDSNVEKLRINRTELNVDTGCNIDLLDLTSLTSGLGSIVFNRQRCADETLKVDALHIDIPNVITVTASHSEAGADGCGCRECAA